MVKSLLMPSIGDCMHVLLLTEGYVVLDLDAELVGA